MDIERIGKSTKTKIKYYKEIDSTHVHAKEIQQDGDCVLIAEIQTNGIGTKGRIWHTGKENNIAMTIIKHPECKVAELKGLTIQIAEKIQEVIKELYGYELKIKMPTNVISVKWDVISKKYKNIEFGNFRNKLKDLLKNMNTIANEISKDNSNETKSFLEKELIDATNKIWGTLGNSFVIYEGDKILIVDKLPKEQAKNVILMNNGGIAIRIIRLAEALCGRLPGALAESNVLANMFFGAISGSGNAAAAEYTGVKVNKVLIQTYILSGILSATAGLLYCGRTKAAKYTYGEGVEMDVIAAVVLGGTAMSGGTGNILGSIVGALLMGMINNGLIMGGLSVSQQKIVRGIIIIIAVAIGNLQSRKKKV